MTVLIITTFTALVLGVTLPLRSAIWGFLTATVFIFITQVVINTSRGFAGETISDSIELYFNGDFISYLGYNAQITYRGFMGPLLVLASLVIYRFGRNSSRQKGKIS